MSRRACAALAAIAAAALAARVVLASQSLVGDELFTYDIVAGASLGDVLVGVRESESTPPLYYLLAWVAALAGDTSAAIRAPSIVLGTATVPLAFVLARRAGGTAAGLIAAGGLALSPFAVYYGSEARAYATAAFFVAAAAVLLPAALERRSRRLLALFAAAIAAAVLSHYTAGFAVGWLALWAALFHRERLRELAVAYAAATAAVVLWLPFAREGAAAAVIEVLAPLTAENVAKAVAHSLVGLMPPVPLEAVPGRAPAYVLLAVAACASAGLAVRVASGAGARRAAVALVAGLALVTPLGLLLYSAVAEDIFVARNLFVSAPAAWAVLAIGLAALPPLPRLALAGLAAVALIAGIAAADGDDGRRAPYDDAAALVEDRLGPADPVVEVDPFPEGPLADALEVALGGEARVIEAGAGAGAVRAAAADAERLALVETRSILGPGPASPPFPTHGLRRAERRVFRGSADLTVSIYRRAP